MDKNEYKRFFSLVIDDISFMMSAEEREETFEELWVEFTNIYIIEEEKI